MPPLTGYALSPVMPSPAWSVAVEESVDFMVIAGDLYDGKWKDYNSGHFFCREMGRLNKAGIPVYLLFGNHDTESEMIEKFTLPANIHTFDQKAPGRDNLQALQHSQSIGGGIRSSACDLQDHSKASFPKSFAHALGIRNCGVFGPWSVQLDE